MNPENSTILKLFADSGGYCQKPDCANSLFIDAGSASIHIAEMAHIVAASDNGPRGDKTVSDADKRSYDNLILLCANCHTLIDKAPRAFPDNVVHDWKKSHVEKLKAVFGAITYPDRQSARNAVEPKLLENRYVFDRFGPNNEYSQNPESELAVVWQRKVKSTIIPNNRRILAILDANLCHLSQREKETLEAFRQHIDDLEAKHIGSNRGEVASQFPTKMNNLLLDNQNE